MLIRLLSVLALARILLLLLFDSIVSLTLGSGTIGCVDDCGFAGGFELFEGLLEEGGGVFAGAAAFHVGGDVGPEAGREGVFDFFLGEEEVLVLCFRVRGLARVRLEKGGGGFAYVALFHAHHVYFDAVVAIGERAGRGVS